MFVIDWLIINWLVIGSTATSVVTAASVIAKLTPNNTDNQVISKIQKVVDLVAMSSSPTKFVKMVLDERT